MVHAFQACFLISMRSHELFLVLIVCTGLCLLYCNTITLGPGIFLTEDTEEPRDRNQGAGPCSGHSLSAQPGQTLRVSYTAVQSPYLAARHALRKGMPGTTIVPQKWGLGFLPVHQFQRIFKTPCYFYKVQAIKIKTFIVIGDTPSAHWLCFPICKSSLYMINILFTTYTAGNFSQV